jgi:putative NADH-flavin reductase
MNSLRITIFGAAGRVGQGVVSLALARGYTVTAFVHTRNPFTENKRLRVVPGDVNDMASVAEALDGSQVVISVVSSWHTKDKNILERAMTTIIPAMEAAGITRLITLTGSGALSSGDRPGFSDKIAHALAAMVASKILADGEKHLKLLAQSNLDWTCIRSPIMTGQRRSTYRLAPGLAPPLSLIPRAAVVQALVDQVESSVEFQQAPSIMVK